MMCKKSKRRALKTVIKKTKDATGSGKVAAKMNANFSVLYWKKASV